jgi:hypothetical protein
VPPEVAPTGEASMCTEAALTGLPGDFEAVALTVLEKAWPLYRMGCTGGEWVARYGGDRLAPVLSAESPEALTLLLGADLRRRQRTACALD